MSPDVKRVLPRGRHALPAHEVRASQRARLLRAMLESVAQHGYAATTVPEVVASARVSRNAFYALFADKTDCFLSLCDELAGEMLDELFALDVQDDWQEAVRTGTEVYLRWWQERPAFSRTYFVELPAAGPRAIEQRDRQYARFRAMFEQLAQWSGCPQPDLVPRVLVLAITELVAEEVRRGRVARLTELHDGLVALMLRMLAGPAS